MTDLTDLTRFTDGSIASRAERLPGPLRELHRAVLRRFLEAGAPPTARWLRQAAADAGLDASARLAATGWPPWMECRAQAAVSASSPSPARMWQAWRRILRASEMAARLPSLRSLTAA